MKTTKYRIIAPNSSGQGYSPLADYHILTDTVVSFGYVYSHSINVGNITGDGWHLYHTFKHGEHNVSLIEDRDIWYTSTSCSSGREWTGKGKPELKAHLASKRKRYGLK